MMDDDQALAESEQRELENTVTDEDMAERFVDSINFRFFVMEEPIHT